jgi:beta-glucuronidase
MTPPIKDPFHHLHDEGYLAAYDMPRLGAGSLVSLADRPRTSLCGPWHFTLDLFDEGLRQKWFALEAVPAAEWTHPRDYDPFDGATLDVPGNWSMQKPEWLHFEGGGWYTRVIEHIPDPQHPSTILRVGAANYQTRVFLNGRFVGTHLGASTPFCVDLSQHLQPGPNRLQIQVDNRRELERVPMRHFDWFNHGGIYREVDLLQLPAVHILSAQADWSPDMGLRVRIQLSQAVDTEACCHIDALGMRLVIPVVAGAGQACIPCNPRLWSPQDPHLYEVRFVCGPDHFNERIGFRHISTSGTQVLLNGRPIFLRGICVHEDDVVLGKVSTEADVRRRLEDARAMGCNFLRLAHYPHHEHVARIADEVGMLLWEEIPVYWAIDFSNPRTLADARNQLEELILRDHNRASVIFWGVGNENEDSDARLAFMRALADTARALDPSRLVSAACLINREHFRIEDRLAEHLEVIGINEYFGWYEPGFEGLHRLLNNSRPDRPVMITETGADAQAGHHGQVHELFTEECQARILTEQVNISAAASYVCGIAPWLLYDFRSERRHTVFNAGFNRKGVIAEDKVTRKLGFHALADCYAALRATWEKDEA